MQAQDTSTLFFLKFWPWLEVNIKRIVIGAGIVAVIGFVIGFYTWRQNQRQIDAAKALTKAMLSPGDDLAGDYLKVATDYSSTRAGAWALLAAATTLFTQGKYDDAQAQFQHFLDSYPDDSFSAQALLGLAACLDTQEKTDAAMNAYKNMAGQSSDENAYAQAKFSLASIYDSQGKLTDARNLYEDVVRDNPRTSLAEEASVRMEELMLSTVSASGTSATVGSSTSKSN